MLIYKWFKKVTKRTLTIIVLEQLNSHLFRVWNTVTLKIQISFSTTAGCCQPELSIPVEAIPRGHASVILLSEGVLAGSVCRSQQASQEDFYCTGLIHWARDKMTANSQMTFSNAFSWMKRFAFSSKCQWNMFPMVRLIINHWFR